MKAGQARSALNAAADLIFPRSCLSCGAVPDAPPFRHLCGKCVAQIDYVKEPCCSTCGHPYFGAVIGERICPHCSGLVPTFREGRTTVLCKGPARALVHELKYRKGLYALEDMETILRANPRIGEWIQEAVLVPVPLHPRKLRERGYNQSLLLAEALVRVTSGRARIAEILSRVVDTESQTGFDRKTRLANLKNAFALTKGVAINPEHHYVLVDDVFTTGSTLNSCARVLRGAGCLKLDVVTFGHG